MGNSSSYSVYCKNSHGHTICSCIAYRKVEGPGFGGSLLLTEEWITHGWWWLNPGETKKVMTRVYEDEYGFYAYCPTCKIKWGNEMDLSISQAQFQIYNAQNKMGETAKFSYWKVNEGNYHKSGNVTWTYR